MEVKLRNVWKGFQYDRIEGNLEVFESDGLVLISGCVTTTSPFGSKAGFDTRLDYHPLMLQYRPRRERAWFLAPIAVSRYEGIRQCAASAWVNNEGFLYMHYHKNAMPMVVHFSGFAFCSNDEEDAYELQSIQKLKIEEVDPPRAQRCGDLVMLQGCFQESKLGSSEKVAVLPKDLRPKREVRCLAPLLVNPDPQSKRDDQNFDDYVGLESIAITVQPDGGIYVQGGFVYNVDKKGHMRKLSQKKKGKVCLDGVRFLLCDGMPLKTSSAVKRKEAKESNDVKPEVSSLMQKFGGAGRSGRSAVCKRLPCGVVVLEGSLDCANLRNTKLALAQLPDKCRPGRRQSFFTRDRSEERCRVDIDQWGRIFCPESPGTDGVELSGILFVACDEPPTADPRDWDWDELDLQYAAASEEITGQHKQLVDEFIQRCNKYEWDRFDRTIRNHMRMPLGDLRLRGHRRDPFNFGWEHEHKRRAWVKLQEPLRTNWGIQTPQQLWQLPQKMLVKVLDTTPCSDLTARDRKDLLDVNEWYHKFWESNRQPGQTFKHLEELADELAAEMFERWDLDAQVKGLLDNNYKLPEALEKFFPKKRWKEQPAQKDLSEQDKVEFDRIRQFFYYHETNGNSMTHCSLKGCSDTFTDTGKWFFPDSVGVQDELFKGIAWLYDRRIYHYISERQTARFPFIEDFDIQADPDFADAVPVPEGEERSKPPDWLIMEKPKRHGDGLSDVTGDPGILMKMRAACIRMLFSQMDELRCLVYSASGYNKGKDKLKTSFHLVWPDLVVDADSAPLLRELTLVIFSDSSGDLKKLKRHAFLGRLYETLLKLEKGVPEVEGNCWSNVFDKTTISATNGLRLPYNDKASMKPTPEEKERIKRGEVSKSAAKKVRVIEGRPSKAIGEILFKFPDDNNIIGMSIEDRAARVEAKWVKDEQSIEKWQWIKQGSCRIDVNDQVRSTLTQVAPSQEANQIFEKWKKEGFAKKQGLRYFASGNDDGLHAVYPNIKLCSLSVQKFTELWDELIEVECEAYENSNQEELFKALSSGKWIHVTETQALWRTHVSGQYEMKDPMTSWAMRKLKRPAEVLYVRFQNGNDQEMTGKVIVDGPDEIRSPLEKILESERDFERDDRAVMTTLDTRSMMLK